MPRKPTRNYKALAAVLHSETARHAAYLNATLHHLGGVKTNLEAYEILERLEGAEKQMMARFRMLATDVAYEVLKESK